MSILSGHARVAGIAGWPVTYSRSPRLHGFWLQRHGIDGAYIPLAIRPGEFATAMRGLLAAGFAGANVTIPHKIAAFEVCDTIDETAQRAGRSTHWCLGTARSPAATPTAMASWPIFTPMGCSPRQGQRCCSVPAARRARSPRRCSMRARR